MNSSPLYATSFDVGLDLGLEELGLDLGVEELGPERGLAFPSPPHPASVSAMTRPIPEMTFCALTGRKRSGPNMLIRARRAAFGDLRNLACSRRFARNNLIAKWPRRFRADHRSSMGRLAMHVEPHISRRSWRHSHPAPAWRVGGGHAGHVVSFRSMSGRTGRHRASTEPADKTVMSTWWRRLSLSHPDGEAYRLTGRSQGTDRSEERQHFVDRSEGQKLGERPAPASCRVHRCAGQEP